MMAIVIAVGIRRRRRRWSLMMFGLEPDQRLGTRQYVDGDRVEHDALKNYKSILIDISDSERFLMQLQFILTAIDIIKIRGAQLKS